LPSVAINGAQLYSSGFVQLKGMVIMQINKKTRYVVFTGVFSLLAIVLYFIEIPIPLFSGYLKVDLSDLPALLAGIMFGPVAGVTVELIKNLVHVVFKGIADSFGYGDLMNFIVGVAVVVPFSSVMRFMLRKKRGIAISSLLSGIAGLIVMVAVGVIGNYLIAPPFFKAVLHITLDGAALWSAIGMATLLNLIKSVMLAVLVPPIIIATKKYFIQLLRE
jgi:riboflavin transporter FmnP